MAIKRGEREPKENLPSKIRRKSAYSVFKGKFLASEEGTSKYSIEIASATKQNRYFTPLYCRPSKITV